MYWHMKIFISMVVKKRVSQQKMVLNKLSQLEEMIAHMGHYYDKLIFEIRKWVLKRGVTMGKG
jgi:hypothetical protein